MKKILVLTNIDDPHSDAVIKNIKNNESVFRINTDQLLDEFSFDFQIGPEGKLICFKNPLNHYLDIEEVSVIYYRRPERPKIQNYDGSFSNLIIQEAWHGLYHLLFSAYKKKWLGHPHLDKYASSRVVQLTLAQKIGWKVPPTLISRDPERIKQFAKKYSELAVKPLGEKGVSMDGDWFPYFTSKIFNENILNKSDEEIALTYNYIQSYIPKKNEWRITVIGDEVFPCIINSQKSELGKIDWRTVDYQTILHEKGFISESFKNELIQYLKYLNLPFGAFDFILTPENEFVFLECNPNGQWLWIEELAGLPISKAIANWLEKINNDSIS